MNVKEYEGLFENHTKLLRPKLLQVFSHHLKAEDTVEIKHPDLTPHLKKFYEEDKEKELFFPALVKVNSREVEEELDKLLS